MKEAAVPPAGQPGSTDFHLHIFEVGPEPTCFGDPDIVEAHVPFMLANYRPSVGGSATL
ncbi:MAG: hypothetical protein ACRDHX_10240 [Chloroflexota bacterium]